MKIKRLTTILIALCLSICLLAFTASAAEVASGTEGSISWVVTDDGVLTISGTGPVTGYSYDSAPWYKYRTSITKVVVDSGITEIGGHAFYSFDYLVSVELSDTVTELSSSAFYAADQTPAIYVDVNNPYLFSDFYGVLYDADMTVLYMAPTSLSGDYLVPATVEVICNSAFYECIGLTKITLQEGLKEIQSNAFRLCSGLTTVNLPSTVEELDSTAFEQCDNLAAVYVDSDNAVYCSDKKGVVFDKEMTRIILVPTGLPGDYAIPDGITEIDGFYAMSALTSVYIPASVVDGAEYCFAYCSALSRIDVDPNNPNYSSDDAGVLFNKDKTIMYEIPCALEGPSYTIPSSVEKMWASFYECMNLTRVVIPSTMTVIHQNMFVGCRNLVNVVVPNTLTYIDENAFQQCSSLELIYIPDGVTGIAQSAFTGCTSLTSVSIPGSVQSLGLEAFSHCESLSSVTLSEGLTYIGDVAFQCCYALTEITIPSTVTYLGDDAFNLCHNLANVYFLGDAPESDGAPIQLSNNSVPMTCWYPAGNETWTEEVRESLGRFCNWQPYEDIEAPTVKSYNISDSGKIKLTWDECFGAVKYQVYRSTSKTGTYKLMKTTTGTTYTNTSAKAGTTYYYYVVAVADDGTKSDKSNIITRTCDCARPDVTVSSVAKTGKIKLTWDAVDGAVSYKVYRATSKTGTYKLMKTTTGTTYTNTSAKVGTLYYYKVVAIGEKSAATSADSRVVSRTCDLPRPDVSIALKNKKPRLTWDAIDGAVSYKIYRATSKNGNYTLMKTTTGTSYTNTSAKSGTTYYYKVIAVHSKSAANSAYSLVDSIKSK